MSMGSSSILYVRGESQKLLVELDRVSGSDDGEDWRLLAACALALALARDSMIAFLTLSCDLGTVRDDGSVYNTSSLPCEGVDKTDSGTEIILAARGRRTRPPSGGSISANSRSKS